VPFFHGFMVHVESMEAAGLDTTALRACISDVSQELECKAYSQRESFNNVQVLHILAKGLVVLNMRVAYNGTVWGEDFVLSDTSLIQQVSGFALTYIEVLCLSRQSFMQVIERRRSSCPQLGQIVRRYCVRIAVYRGILAEAHRRSLLQQREEEEEAKNTPPSSPAVMPLPGLVDIEE
ncbi:Potassium channel AKT2/3, partial [Durusdinium trenchii]